jgi:peptide/nickel transport system ATP-binding protein
MRTAPPGPAHEPDSPLLSACELSHGYTSRLSLLDAPRVVRALDGASLDIPRAAALALVGRSGSGKSTLARCLARLEEPQRGSIRFLGHDVTRARGRALLPLRRAVQLVVQDPGRSLNPRWDAAEVVAEPLVVLDGLSRAAARKRARVFLERVGLDPDRSGRRPGQLSGGQRQRLALARALAAGPSLLILDESLSGLDPSIAAQMLELLGELRRTLGVGLLLITHDLDLAACAAERIAVMEAGRVVEEAGVRQLLEAPRHPFTRSLVAAASAPPARSA